MGALQVLVFVASALVIVENGCWRAEGASYAFTTHLQSSSANRAATRVAPTRHRAVAAPGTTHRANLGTADYRRYLPVEDTPEVKEAKERFFKLYKKQATLAAEAPDNDLDGQAYRTNNDDYYYDDYEEDSNEYEGDDDDEEEEEDSEEGDDDDDDEEDDEDDDDDDDEDEDEEDSDEEDEDSDEDDDDDDSSSSSSEEDGEDSSSSEEDGEDSSSSEEDGEDSSSSSSSSSSEEDEGTSWGSRGYQPLNTNALRPVTDTPEVKQAKRNFFNLYKAQAELSFNAPDDK